MVSVKPEMMAEFQNLIKNDTNPGLRKGGVLSRDVWQRTAAAGDAFEYIIVAPIEKMSQFDGPSPLEQGLGKEGFAAWQAKASRLVTSVRRYVMRTHPDMSYEGKMTGPPKLAVVTTVYVAPGRSQDYENYIKNDYLPVVKQSQAAGFWVAEAIFGGDANEYISLLLRDNFADIDKGPVTVQVLGAEGARKLGQKLPAGTVTRIERSLIKYVPELSIMPAETSSR